MDLETIFSDSHYMPHQIQGQPAPFTILKFPQVNRRDQATGGQLMAGFLHPMGIKG